MRAVDALDGIGYDGLPTDNMGLRLGLGAQNGANLALGLKMSGGETAGEWINNAPYVTQQIIPFLIDAPKAFDLFPDPEKLYRNLKTLIEVRSKAISGIIFNTTVEKVDTAVGRSGQMHSEAVKTSADRIEPVHEWDEVLGLGINGFWEWYIKYLIGDKDMGFPLVCRFEKYTDAEYLPDMKTFTVLYVVPDLAHRRAVRAVLQTNMFPDNAGSLEYKRDLTSGGEIPSYSINFGGLSQTSEPVRKMGTKFLGELISLNVDPNQIPAFNPKIAPGLEGLKDQGYNRVGNPPV